MSRYGENGDTGYCKEDLYETIREFLEDHSFEEFLRIQADVVGDMKK